MPKFIYDLRFRTFLFGLGALATALLAAGESGWTLVLRLGVLATLTLLAVSSGMSWRRDGRWALADPTPPTDRR